MNKVIAYILNFDKDDNARRIGLSIPCKNYIIDSSGKNKNGFIKTDTTFAAGCINKSIEHFNNSDATHCLFICSDVIGDWSMVIKAINELGEDIGIYTPSVQGQGWKHEKPKGISYRDIPFAEGMICCYSRKIIDNLGKIDPVKNAHCYGIDIYAGFICKQLGMKCICDDSISVYHTFGSSYNQKEGEKQMRIFIKSKGIEFIKFCEGLGLFIEFRKRFVNAIRRKTHF